MYHDPMMIIALHDVEKNTRQQFEAPRPSELPSRSALLALLGLLKVNKKIGHKKVGPTVPQASR